MPTFSPQMASAGLIATLLLMNGCTQPPMEQLAAAQKAVDAAKTAGATDYAKEEFAALEQRLAIAENEMAKEDNALSIFRSYADAEKMLITVVESAGSVAAKAAQNKIAAKTAVLVLEQEAQLAVASAKELMGKAPIGKERAALETIKQDIAELESMFNAGHQLIEMGDYFGADVQANAVKDKSEAISGEIQRVIDKAKEIRRNAGS